MRGEVEGLRIAVHVGRHPRDKRRIKPRAPCVRRGGAHCRLCCAGLGHQRLLEVCCHVPEGHTHKMREEVGKAACQLAPGFVVLRPEGGRKKSGLVEFVRFES